MIPGARRVQRFGVISVPNNHASYPALALNTNGKGAVGFTLVGDDYYPSAAYAIVDNNGIGPVTVANPGLAPQDGFTAISDRPRWGDYGAGAVDESGAIYLASEYIASPACTAAQYAANPSSSNSACFGASSGRTYYANWATSITKLHPGNK